MHTLIDKDAKKTKLSPKVCRVQQYNYLALDVVYLLLFANYSQNFFFKNKALCKYIYFGYLIDLTEYNKTEKNYTDENVFEFPKRVREKDDKIVRFIYKGNTVYFQSQFLDDDNRITYDVHKSNFIFAFRLNKEGKMKSDEVEKIKHMGEQIAELRKINIDISNYDWFLFPDKVCKIIFDKFAADVKNRDTIEIRRFNCDITKIENYEQYKFNWKSLDDYLKKLKVAKKPLISEEAGSIEKTTNFVYDLRKPIVDVDKRKEQQKKYREKNRHLLAEKQKEYRLRKKESGAKAENPENKKKRQAVYREKNRELLAQKERARRLRKKELKEVPDGSRTNL